MFNQYSALLFSAFLCVSMNSFAKEADQIVKKPPIECTDHENYDTVDCHNALELRKWEKDQEKVPDEKRRTTADLGDDLLIEKATEFRIGLHSIKNLQSKKRLIGVKIGTKDSSAMYAIASGEGYCSSNSIDILKNSPDFTFFIWECESVNKDGTRGQAFDYYIFDKRYSRLNNIISSDHQDKIPTLTFSKRLYKFSWLDYKQSDGRPNPIYYDFKVTGNRPADLKCGRTWNDECDITMIAPIPQNQYKILDE